MHSTKGVVACTQPLAAKCGIKVLEKGGNAAVCSIFTFAFTIIIFSIPSTTPKHGAGMAK